VDTYYDLTNFFEMATVNVLRPEGESVAGPTLEREVEDPAMRMGSRGMRRTGARLFSYDRTRGLAQAGFQYAVTKSDRMSEFDAAAMLSRIHAAYHLFHLQEEQYFDFDNALFICYALNGASQLLPSDRVTFAVGTSEFDFKTVHSVVGVDLRRFFRAYANSVVESCRRLYYHFDLTNEDHIYARELMIQLADDRNVSRAPWLVADCAEAATNLDSTERAIVAVSKQTVIGGTANSVDRRRIGGPIRSLDNYDSSTMQAVSNSHDIHGSPEYRL